LRKLHPAKMSRNPVMFVTEVGACILLVKLFIVLSMGASGGLLGQLTIWLWFTVIFANFAEAVAEGRGKAQADSLRHSRQKVSANRVESDGSTVAIPAESLRQGDVVLVSAGEVIPSDGDIVEGVASVNESAITGESAPVIREAGGDRSAVTGGTTVLSDWIKIAITANAGESFMDKMISLIEGAERQKTPNELALSILLSALSLIFLLVMMSLYPMLRFLSIEIEPTLLVALLVCLIPTTIGGLLSAVGIAGIDRLVQKNVLAVSGRAVEAAGDVDVLLLDKTGTITLGNRQASNFLVNEGANKQALIDAAVLASLVDETPEGKSIITLAGSSKTALDYPHAVFIPFTAQTRMSGVDIDGQRLRKGASDAIEKFVGKPFSVEVRKAIDSVSSSGGTPLVVANQSTVFGVVALKDVVKSGLADRFKRFRAMGIKTVMITGDNPLTARAIAAEAGVDDFLAEATPEQKLDYIKKQQAQGRLVAMTGDGTNDAPALAQADVGVAMNSGTQAAKEAGNMVDLDSNPTKLIEIVEIGKQLLMTRGSLTTFSIANDVAKYFAILPAMFVTAYPESAALNVMGLGPNSAILSAVIFNALIIVALIPLALKGIRFRPLSPAAIFRRNILLFGLGGLITPFVGIKLIDILISLVGLV
jgi:K+-transporting ATPase ATPase B chain